MRKILLLFLAMFVGFGLNAQGYFEDFDSFTSGDYLAVVSEDWTTWSDAPGTAEDPVISDAFALSAPNAVLVSGTNDGVFPCGDLTSGAYTVSFDMYVPTDRVGYFNIQQVFASQWGMSLTFMPDQSITVSAGGEAPTGFTFTPDTWFNVVVNIDLDADAAVCYIDDEMIVEWQWSLTESGTPGTLQLGCVNTYAYDGGIGGTPEYYFDNFSFDVMSDALYFEDFDDFTSGDYLGIVDPENWTTWTNAPGTAEDPIITDEASLSSPNAVMVSGTNDGVFPCGDLTSGSYAIEFDMMVPAGFAGYYNLQHVFASEWAVECYMQTSGATQISAGGQTITDAVFPFDTWWTVKVEVDMNDDWATMYWDDEVIIEWQWSLKTDGTPGTNQLGCVNMYAGSLSGTGDTPKYYFDNFGFYELSTPLAPPTAEVDTEEFMIEISDGIAVTETFNIANVGEQDLSYEVFPVYNVEAASGSATGTMAYCGDFDAGIGSDGAVARKIAVLFLPSIQADYIGTELTSIEFYMADVALDLQVKCWAMGSTTVPGPGEEIYSANFNPTVGMWNTYELTEPILITGEPIYVGVSYFQPAGVFAFGSDIGPRMPGVNWSSTGPGWSEFSLDRNWNIKGNVTGDPVPSYIDVPIDAGMILPGMDETVGVFVDPTGLDVGTYTSQIVVATNDPVTNYNYIDVTLDIALSTSELNKTEAVVVYPNPTSDQINLQADQNITEVKVTNYLGQIVNVYEMNETQSSIDMSQLESGVYFIEVTTEASQHTIKVVKK